MLSYLELRTDRKHGQLFQARLMKLIKSIEGMKGGGKKYRLTVAFYPLDPDA